MRYHQHSTGRVCVWLPMASMAWSPWCVHPDRVHREPDKRRRNSFARTPVEFGRKLQDMCATVVGKKDRSRVRASWWIDARAC